MGLILPEHYDPRLSVRETQEAIKYIRDKKGLDVERRACADL